MKVCSVEKCNRQYAAIGLCRAHYYRFRKNPNAKATPIRFHTTKYPVFCYFPDCPFPHFSKGLCRNHFSKAIRAELMKKCLVCEKRVKVKDREYCSIHNKKFQKYGDPNWKRTLNLCLVKDCNRVHYGNGYCVRHNKQMKEYGLIKYNNLYRQCNNGIPRKIILTEEQLHKTTTQVGKELGLTRQRISQIKRRQLAEKMEKNGQLNSNRVCP